MWHLILLICVAKWDLYEDYSGSAVGCVQCCRPIYQRHMTVMWNVCIPVLQVTLLIAISL